MNRTILDLSMLLALPLSAAELHPALIRVQQKTSSTYRISDPDLQRLHDRGTEMLKGNLKEFAPGMQILVEGGG